MRRHLPSRRSSAILVDEKESAETEAAAAAAAKDHGPEEEPVPQPRLSFRHLGSRGTRTCFATRPLALEGVMEGEKEEETVLSHELNHLRDALPEDFGASPMVFVMCWGWPAFRGSLWRFWLATS